ncbi:uncharacterized protein LOC108861910 [Raphanus sativus]|uniref:Uncharacterized protein LOC108861910 n=1 Tax=Raphanus sativus TaxID=3726 RepID=A0A9W3CPW8_RAPSA|nr:uncharacterized protein LOC108861910 [Raphanus sativus]
MAPPIKQTFVLEVSVRSEKDRTKAMEIVGGTKGVVSVQCEKGQGKLTVEGEDVDLGVLIQTLEKKVGSTLTTAFTSNFKG